MAPLPDEERDYLLRRCADHLTRAAADGDEDRKALHHRFATLYRERADAIEVVEED